MDVSESEFLTFSQPLFFIGAFFLKQLNVLASMMISLSGSTLIILYVHYSFLAEI